MHSVLKFNHLFYQLLALPHFN